MIHDELLTRLTKALFAGEITAIQFCEQANIARDPLPTEPFIMRNEIIDDRRYLQILSASNVQYMAEAERLTAENAAMRVLLKDAEECLRYGGERVNETAYKIRTLLAQHKEPE